MRPDVSYLLNDPDLGGGAFFTVTRKTLERKAGRLVAGEIFTFTATGNVQPAGSSDLEQIPQEDRLKEILVFRSTFAFQQGQDSGLTAFQPDEITWNNHTYRVLRVENWGHYGMYYAYATLIETTNLEGGTP